MKFLLGQDESDEVKYTVNDRVSVSFLLQSITTDNQIIYDSLIESPLNQRPKRRVPPPKSNQLLRPAHSELPAPSLDPQRLRQIPIPLRERAVLVAFQLELAVPAGYWVRGRGAAGCGRLETAAFAAERHYGVAGLVFGTGGGCVAIWKGTRVAVRHLVSTEVVGRERTIGMCIRAVEASW